MGQLDHVIHDAVVGQLVDSLEVALEAEGAADEFTLLLFDLYVDVVLNWSLQLRLKHFDLLVGSVRATLPVWQMHLFFGHLLFIIIHPVLIVVVRVASLQVATPSAVSIVIGLGGRDSSSSLTARGPTANAMHVEFDLVMVPCRGLLAQPVDLLSRLMVDHVFTYLTAP